MSEIKVGKTGMGVREFYSCEKCNVSLTDENSYLKLSNPSYDYHCKTCYVKTTCKRCGKKLLPPGVHTCVYRSPQIES